MGRDDDDDRYSIDDRELERMRRRDRRRHTNMVVDNGGLRDIIQALNDTERHRRKR